jgi:RNA polymerase sigma-70 factor (ECF subfamily)
LASRKALANGQPAAAAYRCGSDGIHRAHAIVVLTATTTGISRIVIFGEPRLFSRFSLPPTLPAAGATAADGSSMESIKAEGEIW